MFALRKTTSTQNNTTNFANPTEDQTFNSAEIEVNVTCVDSPYPADQQPQNDFKSVHQAEHHRHASACSTSCKTSSTQSVSSGINEEKQDGYRYSSYCELSPKAAIEASSPSESSSSQSSQDERAQKLQRLAKLRAQRMELEAEKESLQCMISDLNDVWLQIIIDNGEDCKKALNSKL